MSGNWSLTIPAATMATLRDHLFPGDGDEHGAVIGATVVRTAAGTRLLTRRLFLARDGIDYVPGQRGYRMLTATFVLESAATCADQGLTYLAIHCHGGVDNVGFSGDDLASHERGYPALLDILNGPPVGGLVFARNAVAGDIWLPGGERVELTRVDVPGRTVTRMFPSPPSKPRRADDTYDRQARLFGDRGQSILQSQKVAVVGAGGAGALVNEYLARLGVGHLVVVDPERIDPTNLPRVVGASRRDARPWLSSARLPHALRRLGEGRRSSKVDIARRVATLANPNIRFDAIQGDITDPAVATLVADCDYIFLAADSMQARLITNSIVHQYLVPGVQVGAKVQVDLATGTVGDVFSVVRPLIPGQSCLWCNELISPSRLAEEATDPQQRARQRYVDEVPAPSVITLNAVAASHAVNDYLFSTTGLASDVPLRWKKFHPQTDEAIVEFPRQEQGCPECQVRLGAGRSMRLPTKVTAPC